MNGIAIVTGASSGIGQEIARLLSARGRAVLAVARRGERLEALARKAKEQGHAAIHPLAVDVASEEGPARVGEAARELGGAAWLVNNAGVMHTGHFHGIDPVKQAKMVRLNCEAMVALTAVIVPELVARKAGVILNVASLAGFQPTPFMSVYGATKAFVLSFTEGLSEELRGTGVTATALCPGPVTTEIFEAAGEAASRTAVSHDLSPAQVARFGVDAAEKGRVVAIPGFKNRLNALGAKVAPRGLVRRVAARTSLPYIGLPPAARKEK